MKGKGIGFLADIRRMNVALTRAKFALWIVGNSKMLSQNTHWKRFADFVKKNDFLVEVDDIDKFFKHYLWRQTQQNVPSLKPMATERQNDDTSHPVGQHKRKLEENCAVSTVTKNNNESLKRQRCEQLSSVSEEREVFSASSKRTFLSSRHHLSIQKSNSNPPFDGTINKSVLKESHIEQ
jgi:ATP-dependent exoDNAse (exonuclease V) beta subunit